MILIACKMICLFESLIVLFISTRSVSEVYECIELVVDTYSRFSYDK